MGRVEGQGAIILALGILFSITLVVVHIIEPEMKFGPLSLYSLGPYGIVMRTGFRFRIFLPSSWVMGQGETNHSLHR